MMARRPMTSLLLSIAVALTLTCLVTSTSGQRRPEQVSRPTAAFPEGAVPGPEGAAPYASVAPAPFPRGISPSSNYSPPGATPGKEPNPRLVNSTDSGVDNGGGSRALSRVRQIEQPRNAAADSFQSSPGKDPNPRLTLDTHTGLPTPQSSLMEQMQAGAPVSAPGSNNAAVLQAGAPANGDDGPPLRASNMQQIGGLAVEVFDAGTNANSSSSTYDKQPMRASDLHQVQTHATASVSSYHGPPQLHQTDGNAAEMLQAMQGREPNPRLKNGPSAAPPRTQFVFQAKPGMEPNLRMESGIGAIAPASQSAKSTPLSTETEISSSASSPSDGGTGIAVPTTVKQVDGNTVQVTQAPAAVPPRDAAMPASSAGVQSAPAMAPVLARAQLRVPQTTKTAPVILESIPLQAEISMRGLLAANGANLGTNADKAAAPAPAAPAPASSAIDMAAFRSALAAELSSASQAAAAPSPGADVVAPSPVSSAVASLAARLRSGQASPALAAQLLATQSLLEAALQAVQRSYPAQSDVPSVLQAQGPSSAVSLQTMPSLPGDPSDILGSGGSMQDAGALLASRLVNAQQELSSALSLFRRYTSRTSAARLTAAPRVVDISAAAANAPVEAAPAPAPSSFSVAALPLLSPTDALAAALRGQDIPTSRQLTPNEDSALRLTDALGVSPPAGSAAASTAPYADTVSASAPEAPEAPAAAPAGSQVPTKQRAPSPADAQAAARASAPAPASVQGMQAQRLRASLADRDYSQTRAVISIAQDLGATLVTAPAPVPDPSEANSVSLALADVVDMNLQSRQSLEELSRPEDRASARKTFIQLLSAANNDSSVRPPRTFGQAAQLTRRTADFLVSRAAHEKAPAPAPAMTAAVAGGPATPTEMAVVVRGPATSPVAQPVAASLVVMNPAYTAGAPDNSVGEPFSAAALSHVSTDRINPLLSATTPEQLALIFQMAEAQASALPPASAAPAAPGPATAATRPNAAQGHALGRSFLQIPGNSPSPDPATLVKQDLADFSNTYNLLRSGGNPVRSKLQDVSAPSANGALSSTLPSWLPVWLGGYGGRKLLEAQAGSLGEGLGSLSRPGSHRSLSSLGLGGWGWPGSRRSMGEGTGASGQDAAGVLGMLRSILPGEQHTGSAPSAKLSYMKPLPITPSENLLYKDYIPGLAGRGDDPGFMSITERLSKMMGLHRQKSGQAPAAAAFAGSDEPHAPAMAFAGEHIQHMQQQVQQQQQRTHGPLIDAAEKAGLLPASVMRETEKRRQLISTSNVPSQQPVQESQLEQELEGMMGKPVHTLSADDGKADASTVLGPKLTNEQIHQLADIFTDSLASGAQIAARFQAEAPTPASLGATSAEADQAAAPSVPVRPVVMSLQAKQVSGPEWLNSRDATLQNAGYVTQLPHNAAGAAATRGSNPGPYESSERFSQGAGLAPGPAKAHIDSVNFADRESAPIQAPSMSAPAQSSSAPTVAPEQAPSMSASASSLSAPAPPAMVLQATGRIAVLPHGTAGAAVKGSAAPPVSGGGSIEAAGTRLGPAQGPAKAHMDGSVQAPAQAPALAPAQGQILGSAPAHVPQAGAGATAPFAAPLQAPARAPAQGQAPGSAALGSAPSRAPIQAPAARTVVPGKVPGTAVVKGQGAQTVAEDTRLSRMPGTAEAGSSAFAPTGGRSDPYPAVPDVATLPSVASLAAEASTPASSPLTSAAPAPSAVQSSVAPAHSVDQSVGMSAPLPPPPPPPTPPSPPPPPPPLPQSDSGSTALSTTGLSSVQASPPSASIEGAMAPGADNTPGRAKGAGAIAPSAPIDLAPRAAAVRGTLAGIGGAESAFRSAPGAYSDSASSAEGAAAGAAAAVNGR